MISSDTRGEGAAPDAAPEGLTLEVGEIARQVADGRIGVFLGDGFFFASPKLYRVEPNPDTLARLAGAAPGGEGVEDGVTNPWVDTRLVQFDDTVMFGLGYDGFDRWDNFRSEMHVPGAGSYAVWGEGKKWSFYGGPDGVIAFERFYSECEAKVEAQDYALSILHAKRLAATPSPARSDRAEAEGREMVATSLIDRMVRAARWQTAHWPERTVRGNLYVAVKREGDGTGWDYRPIDWTVDDVDALAAAPTPPAGEGVDCQHDWWGSATGGGSSGGTHDLTCRKCGLRSVWPIPATGTDPRNIDEFQALIIQASRKLARSSDPAMQEYGALLHGFIGRKGRVNVFRSNDVEATSATGKDEALRVAADLMPGLEEAIRVVEAKRQTVPTASLVHDACISLISLFSARLSAMPDLNGRANG